MKFELTNQQREYLGLEPIESHWERVDLKGDTYRPESFVYFEGDTLKRHIVSYDNLYKETQYNELTKDRKILLPKTAKGKEKKLTASVLESRHPIGVYLFVDGAGNFLIGNYTTQTTFYSTHWEGPIESQELNVSDIIANFISDSPDNHLNEIADFKNRKRRHIKFKSGDFFAFKLNRTEYGFGRILLDVNQIRKEGLVPRYHGLFLLMGPPVLVKLYALSSKTKEVSIDDLVKAPTLPSDYIMDNVLLYGEFEIIGHRALLESEFEFPMSYGRHINSDVKEIFLQWGLIHIEKPLTLFSRYLNAEDQENPYGYYSIGFRPRYYSLDVKAAISEGHFNFDNSPYYGAQFDLRNPKNSKIRVKIMKEFGLDPEATYEENLALTGTIKTTELLRRLKEK